MIENTPLSRMVREAYQTHPVVWKRAFPLNYDAERQHTKTVFETYIRCIAFELGWVYPTPETEHPANTMRAWGIALGAIRTVFDDEARMNDYVTDAVRILLANLRNTCAAPEWNVNAS